MRGLTALLLCGALLPGAAAAQALPVEQQRAWLLGQVRLGEALERDDLVSGALERLQLLEPDSPEAQAAAARLALRRGEPRAAGRHLNRLYRQAPDSPLALQTQVLLKLSLAQGQQALQGARLLAASGRVDEARAAYDRLLGGAPPTLELGLEYWRLRSRQDGQRAQAIAALDALARHYPEHVGLRQTLADLLFDEGRGDEARRLLHQLAAEPQASQAAAQREFQYLAELPLGHASVAAWQEFVRRYPDSPLQAEAQQTLAAQRRQVADPAWQAGQRGEQLLEQGDVAGAEAALRRALRGRPADAGLHGALGLALLRQSRHGEALAAFAAAQRREQDPRRIGKWRDLHEATRYWALLEQAEAAAGERAGQLYRQAQRLRPERPEGALGLAALAEEAGDLAEAERQLRHAERLAPDSGAVQWGLLKLYRRQSPERALAYLEALPAAQQPAFAGPLRELRVARLQQQAEAAAQRGDAAAAVTLLASARRLAPEDPWLAYRLAERLREQGRTEAADAAFADLVGRRGADPQVRYAHALHLSASERDGAALASLRALPAAAWNDDMRALAVRLERRRLLARAEKLRAAGREAQAVALLEGQATLPAEDLLRLAAWAGERGDHPRALDYLGRIDAGAPEWPQARLGQIESWLALGQAGPARAALAALPDFPAEQRQARRRVAAAWLALGDAGRAREQLERLLAEGGAEDAQLLRDTARLQAANAPQDALDLYARGLHALGELDAGAVEPRDDRALTRASRPSDEDDWLARSLRGETAALYQQHNPSLRLQHDHAWRNDDVTPGLSDLRIDTSMLHYAQPLAGGRAFLRVEQVAMDAGRFESEDGGGHVENFGSCALAGAAGGCPLDRQQASGTALALGWRDERWAFDLGRSPDGFEIGNWLGGLSHSGDLAGIGWTLTASRRPLSNSLLSYAGAVDPLTGIRWGGVTASGISLGLSHDRGGDHGVWADLGLHRLRGEKVADNRRLRLMAGYYYRLIERADERLRVGLNAMHWRYEQDLGGYSLGQGGYYSPQRYSSLGLPVSYAWRSADWSLALEGSLGWSQSRSDDSPVYPLGVPAAGAAAVQRGSSGSAVGYRLGGLLERRLGDHWALGAGFTWQQSEDYAPSYAQLQLRYLFEPWQGALTLGGEPLEPYSEFK